MDSVLTSNQAAVSLNLKPIHNNVACFGSDDQIVKSVFHEILKTYKNLEGELLGRNYTGEIEQLLAIAIIIKQLCIIVDNEVNKDPRTGNILTTRTMEVNIRNKSIHLGVDNRDFSFLLARQEHIESEILLVSVNASEALIRLIERRQISYQTSPYGGYYHRDDGGSEEISALNWIMVLCCCVLCFPLLVVLSPCILIYCCRK